MTLDGRVLTLTAVLSTESRVTLTVSSLTLSVPSTAVGTALSHLLRDVDGEEDLLRVRVIVVEGEEPVTLFQEVAQLLRD